jgi:hypothetical protein
MNFEHDLPCDFLTYLEWRLGKDEDATARLLGEWLATYEPECWTARTHALCNVARRPDRGGTA